MIKPIDRQSVHRICSGQVVLTLAVAIKELVENSLDAGATYIDIKLKGDGTKLIQVTDNGSGIAEADFEGITLKHHTSKIRDFDDLPAVATFGFRGEALSSLCAMSALAVHTRHAAAPVGARLEFDAEGRIRRRQALPRGTPGTTVTVADLFAPLPVRRRELERHARREMGRAVQLVTAYALVRPDVRFCVSHQSGSTTSALLTTDGRGGDLREGIAAVFGPRALNQLLAVETVAELPQEVCDEFRVTSRCPELRVSGWISSPAHGAGRSAADRQFLSVNRRPCDLPKVSRVANDVYRELNRPQLPALVLDVSMPRGDVDVNVTPDKRSLLFDHEPHLLALVKASIQTALRPSAAAPQTIGAVPRPPPAYGEDHGAADGLLALLRRRVADSKAAAPQPKQRRLEFPSRQLPSPLAPGRPDLPRPSPEPLTALRPCNDGPAAPQLHTAAPAAPHGPATVPAAAPRSLEPPAAPFAAGDGPPESPDGTGTSPPPVTAAGDGPGPEAAVVALPDACGPQGGRDEVPGAPQGGRDEVPGAPQGRRGVTAEVPFSLAQLQQRLGSRTEAGDAAEGSGRRFRAKIEPGDNGRAEAELQRHLSKSEFPRMALVGQFNLGFLVVRLDEELFIVDQHASDEKFNFERLQRDLVLDHQPLIRPQTLHLSAPQEMTVLDHQPVFEHNGFRLTVDEAAPAGRQIQLTGIPVSKNWEFGVEDIEELIFVLEETGSTACRPSKVRRMLASRACRSSVMIGTALNESEMRRLVDHMAEMDVPWSCPHGRPTIRHLAHLPMVRAALESPMCEEETSPSFQSHMT